MYLSDLSKDTLRIYQEGAYRHHLHDLKYGTPMKAIVFAIIAKDPNIVTYADINSENKVAIAPLSWEEQINFQEANINTAHV